MRSIFRTKRLKLLHWLGFVSDLQRFREASCKFSLVSQAATPLDPAFRACSVRMVPHFAGSLTRHNEYLSRTILPNKADLHRFAMAFGLEDDEGPMIFARSTALVTPSSSQPGWPKWGTDRPQTPRLLAAAATSGKPRERSHSSISSTDSVSLPCCALQHVLATGAKG